MSRRSRRHGRNIKKAISAPVVTKSRAATLKKSFKILKNTKPAGRGRGRWKRTGRKTKVTSRASASETDMKQETDLDEVKTSSSQLHQASESRPTYGETNPTFANENVDHVLKIKEEQASPPEESVMPASDKCPVPDVETTSSVNEDTQPVQLPDAEDELVAAEGESGCSPVLMMDLMSESIPKNGNNNNMEEISPNPESSQSLTCIPCKRDFESSVGLELHTKHHSTINQIHKCLVCGKVLSSASSLDRHMLVHSGERPFKCKYCDMAFTTNGNMHRHMRTHGENAAETPDAAKGIDSRKREAIKRKLSFESTGSPEMHQTSTSDQEKLSCPVCGKSLLCKYGLASHMETHPNDPILCQTCGEISSNYTIHRSHKCDAAQKNSQSNKNAGCGFQELNFMDISTNKFSLVSKSFCEQNIKRPSSAFHVFECSECKKSFPCGRALKLHMKSHSSKESSFCASCDCHFAGPAFLKLHQLKHRSAENCRWNDRCVQGSGDVQAETKENVAGKEDFLALFNLQNKESQLSLLKSLKVSHVKEGNFENMDYFVHGRVKTEVTKDGSEQQLDGHGNNDFADIQSILTLTSKAPLMKDVRTSPIAVRSGSPVLVIAEQPESPQEADPASSSPENPSINSAVQPVTSDTVPDIVPVVVGNIYSCKICNQKFRTINSLKRHSKMHVQRGSNYSCHLCSYVSVDKSTLIRHLRTHNGERPFQCTVCKYAFTTKANCERHVRKRHKKLTKPEIRICMQYNPNMALKTPDLPSSEISSSETRCKYCNVDFKFNRVLRHHLRSLHNSCNRKPFNCKICSFGFSTKNNCIRHVLKQHPNMKDKLRSVVVSNNQRIVLEMPEPESDTNNADNVTDVDELMVVCPDINEQSDPIDLNTQMEEQPLNLSTEQTSSKAITNETVIVAESLVCLSETLLLQDEPLDLAVRPLDLSCKSHSLTSENSESEGNSIPSSSGVSNNLLNLSTQSRHNNYDLSSKSGNERLETCNSNIAVGSTSSESFYLKASEPSRAFTQKYRAFTCVYCSAGFTLKSNMERHIKRKHPEFARPTRSRNFIPAVIAHRAQKNNLNMLSDRTRDALRHVLNTKVQHNVLSSKVYSRQHIPTSIFNTSKKDDVMSSFTMDVTEADDSNSIVDCSVDLTADRSGLSRSERESHLSESSSTGADDNSTDLASVSSVICMANSQQFERYFDKPSAGKFKNQKEETSSEPPEDVQKPSDACVACPFCSRKFPWSSSLRRHILTHTGQKPYKCPKCALWFTTKSNCERHLFRKHGHKGELIYRSVPDRPYKCNQCPSSTFSTQGNLRKHFYLKHWTKSCLGMNMKVINQRHSKETISSDTSTEDSPAKQTSDVSQSSKEHSYSQLERIKTLECHFCNHKVHELGDLSKHMETHDHIIYMCYLCRKTFPTSAGCFAHFKTSHSLVYFQLPHREGDSSEVTVGEPPSVDHDIDDSDSSSAMACMICFQKVSSLDELQQHVKKHLQIVKESDDASKKSGDAVDAPSKKGRPKKKLQNSLLYLFTPSGSSASSTVMAPANAQRDDSPSRDGSDLIQNLLGIHDSKIIDEMLVSADSAARLLGVKEV